MGRKLGIWPAVAEPLAGPLAGPLAHAALRLPRCALFQPAPPPRPAPLSGTGDVTIVSAIVHVIICASSRGALRPQGRQPPLGRRSCRAFYLARRLAVAEAVAEAACFSAAPGCQWRTPGLLGPISGGRPQSSPRSAATGERVGLALTSRGVCFLAPPRPREAGRTGKDVSGLAKYETLYALIEILDNFSFPGLACWAPGPALFLLPSVFMKVMSNLNIHAY